MVVYDKDSGDCTFASTYNGKLAIKGGELELTLYENQKPYTWKIPLFAKEEITPCQWYKDFDDLINPEKSYTKIMDGVRLCDTFDENHFAVLVFDNLQFAICYKMSAWNREHCIDWLQIAVACAVIVTGNIVDLDDIYMENTLQSCSFGDMTGEELYDTGAWIATNNGKELDLLEVLPLLYNTSDTD